MTNHPAPPAAPTPPTAGTHGHRHLGLALVLISVAQLMVVPDSTITNIALPYIGADLGISSAALTWVVTGYALAFGGLLLLGGRLSDLHGRRLVFVLGLVVFAVASLLGGFAGSAELLLAARALQGFGAALAAPAALALVTTTFPAGPSRNRAFAVYAAMSGIGGAVGLILGGWLTGLHSVLGVDLEGWRLTFLINVPIGLVAAVAAPRVLAESHLGRGRLDVPGAVAGTLGLLGIVFGLSRAGEEAYGWAHWQTVAPLAAGAVLLAGFAVVESRVAHPLLPMRIFADRTRAASFVAMMIAPAGMYAMFYFLSLFIQQVMGYSSLRAGFAFLPFSVGIVVGAGLASNLASRVDARVLAGTGTLLASGAMWMLARLDVDDSPDAVLRALAAGEPVGADVAYWSSLFPWIVTMAVGLGLMFVPLTLTAVHRVEAKDHGVGSGVLNTMQQVGGALGLATLSTVALHVTDERAAQVGGPITSGLTGAGVDPATAVPDSGASVLDVALFQATFSEGATHAFLVGGFMMLAASVTIWVFVGVRAADLATDGSPVHVG